MKPKHRFKIWTVVSIVVCIVGILYFANNFLKVETLVRQAGIAGPLISIFLYGLLSLTPIPSDPLSVLNGALFGPVWGIIISWMGNNLAATVEYFIGKGVGEISDFEKKKKNLPWGLNRFPADSYWFLILARAIPGYGGKIVSVVGGIYKVPFWKYLWTAIAANLLGSIAYALSGYGLLKLLWSPATR